MIILLIILIVIVAFAVIKGMPYAFKLMALRAYGNGNAQKALALYKKAAELFGGKTQYKTEYALMLMREGEFKTAENILTSIILDRSILPKDKINVKAYRAMAYHKQGRTDEALEDMEELYKTAKTTVVYGMLGYLRQLGGNAEVELCEEAYEYNSDDRDICDNLLVAYTVSGDFDKAEKISNELIKKYPSFVEGFYHSAQLELKRGNIRAAKAYASRISECRRTMLTTVSEAEVEELKEEINNA